jgi:lysophospholipase L1-like esterase
MEAVSALFACSFAQEGDCMKVSLAALLMAIVVVWVVVGYHLAAADPRVAFLGDSITERWHYPRANFGVHGNTTAQMLARFPQFIPGHNYRAVVILGGTNDVLLKIDSDQTIHNLEILGQDTVDQHAEPILCEIPPIFHSFHPDDTTDYGPAVTALNQRIAQVADAHHWKLVDYYGPLANHPGASADGVHMKRRGYLLMEIALLRKLDTP